MTLYYKATHDDGLVHLRASNNRAYSHAVVGRRSGQASFSGTITLARKESESQAKWTDLIDRQVVPAVEITKAEYTALLKAGKAGAKVVFRGKKYTKTWPATNKPMVAAVGEYTAAHVVTTHFVASPLRREHLVRMESPQLAHYDAAAARGHWETPYGERTNVYWFHSVEGAQSYLEKPTHNEWTTKELLEVTSA